MSNMRSICKRSRHTRVSFSIAPVDVTSQFKRSSTLINRKALHSASLITLTLSLSGCIPNQDLSPPKSGDSLEITLDIPSGLTPMETHVSYHSKICQKKGYSLANGKKFVRDRRQNLILTPKHQEGNKNYKIAVPVDGGGYCQWTLSNIRFGITYQDTEQFGENTYSGTPATVIVRFDEHRTLGGANEKTVVGDLVIEKEFYPWIHESFIGGHKKSINLVGADGTYINFYSPSTRKIHFTPKIHSTYLVTSKGHKEKVIGPHPEFTYPDGRKQREKLGRPNFEKLQTIRIDAEKIKS